MTQLTGGQASRLHAATASLRPRPKQASLPLGHKGSDHSRNDPAPPSTQSNASAQRDVGATGRSVPFTAADRLFRTQRQAVRCVDSGRQRRLAHSASPAAVIRRRLNLDEPLQAGGVDPSELAQLGADHVDAMVPFRHVGRGGLQAVDGGAFGADDVADRLPVGHLEYHRVGPWGRHRRDLHAVGRHAMIPVEAAHAAHPAAGPRAPLQ
eukprot:scaffold25789_cov101-Isochrysis_galbana.AAC.4